MEENNYKYMVCTRCMTYNHAPYIEDALRGFAMQETTFPVVYAVIDDASTDGEPEVLRKWVDENLEFENGASVWQDMPYGQLSVAPLKGKPLSLFVMLLLNENHYSMRKSKIPYIEEWQNRAKYLASCEGDDYWIVSNKLQMQVDFLENHPDYVLCHTDFEATAKRHTHYKEKFEDGNYIPGMFHFGFMIGTLTVMYRAETYKEIPKYYIGKGWPMGDKPLWYELARFGKIKYLPIVTAMYRILPTSASHFNDAEKQIRFKEAGLEITRFYADKYGIVLKNEGFTSAFYTSLLMYAFKFNSKELAEKYYHEAKSKKLLSLEGTLYFYAAKYQFVGKVVRLIITKLR